ncbi:hypothetical protein ACSBR1_030818 [Camellia fascicularis]
MYKIADRVPILLGITRRCHLIKICMLSCGITGALPLAYHKSYLPDSSYFSNEMLKINIYICKDHISSICSLFGFFFPQDIEVNNRNVKVHQSDGVFEHIEWKNLRVGDIVKVEKNEFFPVDLLLLSSSYEDAICYVETMNLDGETNLKLKKALKVTSFLHDDSDFRDFKALVKCEDPNANLYSFVESMEFEEQRHPLTPKQLLLRNSKLRNTDYIYGAVIFTGLDTKVIQNSTMLLNVTLDS